MRGAPAPVGLDLWDNIGNLSHHETAWGTHQLVNAHHALAVTTLSTWGSPALATQPSGTAVELRAIYANASHLIVEASAGCDDLCPPEASCPAP